MKPMLKAPGTKHLKLNFEHLLSSFALIFNLRRYGMGKSVFSRAFVRAVAGDPFLEALPGTS